MKKSIAIVGASADRAKFGNKAARAYARMGWQVFPIHPSQPTIEGFPVHRSVADLPVDRLDRISIYLPPSVLTPLLPSIAAKQANEIWFNPGADAPEVLAAARSLGMNAVAGCSIVDVGVSPHDLD